MGAVIGIGIKNKSRYRYSVIMKYENRIITMVNIESITPGVMLNNTDDNEVIEKADPTETTKYGIILLIGIFIL